MSKTFIVGMAKSAKGHRSENEIAKDNYSVFQGSIGKTYNMETRNNGVHLYTTNVQHLFDTFLQSLPVRARQYYTCNSCRRFVDEFGGLVTIDLNGHTNSAFWDPSRTPPFFKWGVEIMQEMVNDSQVTGVFLTKKTQWGDHSDPLDRNHMRVLPKQGGSFIVDKVFSADQKMEEKKEDYRLLQKALAMYSYHTVDTANNLLKSKTLYRSEKLHGVSQWLFDLYIKICEVHKHLPPNGKRVIDNLVWSAVAKAKPGYCHVSSSMIGTLLDDLESNLPAQEVFDKFAAKMQGTLYMRPQAPPKAGNVSQAAKLVNKMNIEDSLKMRLATINDIRKYLIWSPNHTEKDKKDQGIFSDVVTKRSNVSRASDYHVEFEGVREITAVKFIESILPNASSISIYLAPRNDHNFVTFTTHMISDCVPIFKWDTEGRRLPLSSYVYAKGAKASAFSLEEEKEYQIVGVLKNPAHIHNNAHYRSEGGINFIIEGCKDRSYRHIGLALFPETLKTEYNSIRSTIEQYSKQSVLECSNLPSACGIRIDGDHVRENSGGYIITVNSPSLKRRFMITSWD